MFFLSHFSYIVLFLFLIVLMCLFFTNAIEHLGKKLNFGNNATGSILAVIGTTLPETIVPIIAILISFFRKDSSIHIDVAQGAIFGSPFMLLTFGLFLLGFCLLILNLFKKRKSFELNISIKDTLRSYKYFLFAYFLSVSCLFINSYLIKVLIVGFLISFYLVFVYRTIKKSGENLESEELDELYFVKFFKIENNLFLILSQVALSLIGLVIFSYFFVSEIETFSKFLNVNPMILSLLITPFATELPECVNSIIWTKNSKDELAIANIVGATVFQAMIPMSIGILFTPWQATPSTLLNVIFVFCAALIFVLYTLIRKKVDMFLLLLMGVFYALFFIYR